MNCVWLCVTDWPRTTLVVDRNSALHVVGQSMPGGLLTTRPSLFSLAIATVRLEPLKLVSNVSGAPATPPTVAVIAVRIALEP
jgi:hypothetical protein